MARPIPAHRRLAEEIRRRIVENIYEDDELPPEIKLVEEFDVSRHTMRIALQHLVDDGLIVRQPGRGTKIVRKGRGGYWAIGSLDDLTGEFKVEQSLTISAEAEAARNYPEVASVLNVRPTSRLFHILRVLTSDGLPYGLSNLFAPLPLVKNIPDAELGQTYFVDLVQEYSGHTASRTRQAISAGAANAEAARQLGIEIDSPVLVLKRTYFSSDNTALAHVHLTCRPDRYEQVVTFLRDRRDDESRS